MFTFKILTAACLGALMATTALADTDVSHNWNAENEAAAMKIFRDKYEALGGAWKETAFPDTQASVSSVKTRIIGGQPPMAMQSTLGGTTQEFAGAGMLQNMDDAAAAGNWAANMTESMVPVGQYDGHWFAAPTFVNVINWMYSNNEVLAAAGVTAPNTWAEFTASLPALKAKGVTPIAIGGEPWQEAILFDHVLLGVGGADLYDGLYSKNPEVVGGPLVKTALDEMAKLREFTDEGKAGRSWNDTNTLMLTGKAAYFFMGPWAAGGYADMGPEGEKWSCRLTPWDTTTTIVADGFNFIKVTDAADIAAQTLFAQAVMDPATQIAAAKVMGTLPATNTATAADFEGCPAKAVAAMKSGKSVTHWNGRATDVADAVKDTIDAFWNGSIDAAAAQAQLVDKLK